MSRARNARCHCGSGKKHKLCHGKRDPVVSERNSRVMAVLGIFVVVAIFAIAGFGLFSSDASGVGERPSSSAPGPGPAPAGKVWSPEHNHWH